MNIWKKPFFVTLIPKGKKTHFATFPEKYFVNDDPPYSAALVLVLGTSWHHSFNGDLKCSHNKLWIILTSVPDTTQDDLLTSFLCYVVVVRDQTKHGQASNVFYFDLIRDVIYEPNDNNIVFLDKFFH